MSAEYDTERLRFDDMMTTVNALIASAHNKLVLTALRGRLTQNMADQMSYELTSAAARLQKFPKDKD